MGLEGADSWTQAAPLHPSNDVPVQRRVPARAELHAVVTLPSLMPAEKVWSCEKVLAPLTDAYPAEPWSPHP